ncbi:unnamed protein product [Porites lobata]|uniref:Uncharacterized protein n=1 Tax=Porites lobata TaxID=104759 RepID=A0ABN8S0D8_9CNID|nr:unnamed protein product [Porites lobata]
MQDFPGYEVSLESAITWIIRELRLHGVQKEIIDLSLKLDGRPFAVGHSQVLMDVVPKDTPFVCNQSCKSVCPLDIANCKEDSFKGIRDDLEFLFEEDLSSINLCALHCELRNTEQLLSLLVFFCTKWVHLMNVMPNWQIMALRILAAE